MSAPFHARFDGVCARNCGNRVHPGDMVRYEGDDLVHDECAESPSKYDIQPGEVVCPDCYCIRPCRCLDD